MIAHIYISENYVRSISWQTRHYFQKEKWGMLDSLCFAEFLSSSYTILKSDKNSNDSQPIVLDDNTVEEYHKNSIYPTTIPLMSSKEKRKCGRVKNALQYHKLNPNKYPKKLFHHLLITFYPFRYEDLKHNDSYF